MKSNSLPYLPTMFASCMLFNTIYVLCVMLWAVAPDMAGHALLPTIFPAFKFLDMPSFFYGLLMSAFYGWFVAVVFVFFYNLFPKFVRALTGQEVGTCCKE